MKNQTVQTANAEEPAASSFQPCSRRRFFRSAGGAMVTAVAAEGCPAHPAMPGGHATIAGACVTILKAYFDENFIIPNPVVPSDDSTTLQAFNGTLSVGGELNKLASNLSYGRDTASVSIR
jgi:hypothetical protein